jgi:hypothetical protein
MGRNASALEKTIRALRVGEFDGALRPVDAAKIAAARSLAEQVDVEPGNAQMWRQYREAIEELVPDVVGVDPRSELLADLRSAMGH